MTIPPRFASVTRSDRHIVTRPPICLLFRYFAPVARLAAEIDFARDIRPILSENCFFCHGPDAKQREADLRLDTADGAASVIEASHNSTASELFQRLVSDDDDARMPPSDSNRSLTAAQIGLIGQWIDDGARWAKPLVVSTARAASEVPQVAASRSSETKPDRRVRPTPSCWALHWCLRPSGPSNLIRRLVAGPDRFAADPSEVDAFLNDASPTPTKRSSLVCSIRRPTVNA